MSEGGKANMAGNGLPDYPLNPADQAMQTTAYALAYLTCAGIFIQGRTLEECIADNMAAAAAIPRIVDMKARTVSVNVGRWQAVVRFDPDRGCVMN